MSPRGLACGFALPWGLRPRLHYDAAPRLIAGRTKDLLHDATEPERRKAPAPLLLLPVADAGCDPGTGEVRHASSADVRAVRNEGAGVGLGPLPRRVVSRRCVPDGRMPRRRQPGLGDAVRRPCGAGGSA